MGWSKKKLREIEVLALEDLQKTSSYKDWYFDRKDGQIYSPSFTELAKRYGFKDTWVAGGRTARWQNVPIVYFVGFWCGKDNDLICVLPLKYKETNELDRYLSPEGRTPMDAITKATEKRNKKW